MSGRSLLALYGSGEFQPWTEDVDRRCIERSRDPGGRVLIFPTASAHEGHEVFERWGAMGLAHFARLDVPARVMDVRGRDDAHRSEWVDALEDASMVWFSGGNPARLARALDGTPLWDAVRAAVADGVPYAGCSAGAAALCDLAFDNEAGGRAAQRWRPGLGVLREVLIGPHWDALDRWMPGATRAVLAAVPDGSAFVGIDERTGMIGDGRTWEVLGTGAVHVRRGDSWGRFAAGESFVLPLPMGWGTEALR